MLSKLGTMDSKIHSNGSTKAFKTVASSLRVDALASAGFKISCTKLASLIRYELGMVNCKYLEEKVYLYLRINHFLWSFSYSNVDCAVSTANCWQNKCFSTLQTLFAFSVLEMCRSHDLLLAH